MASTDTPTGLTRLSESGRSIGGNVTTVLRAAIISGDLKAGTRLRQDDLCAELGVSQAPVREALRKLEAEGLVDHVPNRGVYVLALDADEMLNVVAPTRVLLETYAVGAVMASRPEEFIAGLETIVREMEEAAARGDVAAVHDLDVEFHELAIRLCGKPHTVQLWRSVISRLRAEFTRLESAHYEISEIVDEHAQLLSAYRSRDMDVVRHALHVHAVEQTAALLERGSTA